MGHVQSVELALLTSTISFILLLQALSITLLVVCIHLAKHPDLNLVAMALIHVGLCHLTNNCLHSLIVDNSAIS